MLARRLVIGLGTAALLVGAIFLFVPLLGEACGNALSGPDSDTLLDSDVAAAMCTSARVDRWTYVAPMLLGGIAALVAAFYDSIFPAIEDDSAPVEA